MLALLATLVCAPFALPTQDPGGLPGPLEPGRVAAWTIEQGGQRLGECRSHYEGEVALGLARAHLFHDQVALEMGGTQQSFTVDLWTDAQGHPLRFDFRAQLGDVTSGVEGVFVGGKAECVARQGSGEKKLSADAPADSFLLANNFVSQLELLLAARPPADAHAVTLFSANALRSFPYTLKTVSSDAAESVYEDSLGERLHWSADGQLTLVEVPAQKITMRRGEPMLAPFTIALPAQARADDLEREDVTIFEGPVCLAGAITKKKGATGRLPAVFFLSGSGGQDREGYSSGLDLGTHEILDRLTREGFLVLRVDDRGVGGSTGPLVDMTFEDLVADGRSAVHFLLERPDVDPKRVVLIGHSEGAISAPILAASEPIAAVVLMAGPGRPLEALLREQLRMVRERAGATPDELDAFAKELEVFLADVAAKKPLKSEGLAPELAAFVPAHAWLASHLGRDPLPILAKVHCPLLIAQGGRDVQVSAERDAPKLLAALDAAKHPDHELKLFPKLDHLFKVASDPPSELDYFKTRAVDAEFLDALVAWLHARVMK
ncbi:MAG: alpha/beta fold hydrolase [Planctomycetes bacterium]|nr:alpha/beta fold hydrolase [Planctomycetota bacterium]